MWRYLKEAFWARADVAAIGPLPLNALAVFCVGVFGFAEHALWLIGLGVETGYLYLLATHPRFRRAIDAREHARLRQSSERSQEGVLKSLAPADQARHEEQEAKVRRIVELSRDAGGASDGVDDALFAANVDPLRRLCALHLRLLAIRARWQAGGSREKQALLTQQIAALESELAAHGEKFTAALRDSKQATLELTCKRLENAQKSQENLSEIESDLVRIETQLDLALENAQLQGRPVALSGSLNLLNEILESDRALSELDASFSDLDG